MSPAPPDVDHLRLLRDTRTLLGQMPWDELAAGGTDEVRELRDTARMYAAAVYCDEPDAANVARIIARDVAPHEHWTTIHDVLMGKYVGGGPATPLVELQQAARLRRDGASNAVVARAVGRSESWANKVLPRLNRFVGTCREQRRCVYLYPLLARRAGVPFTVWWGWAGGAKSTMHSRWSACEERAPEQARAYADEDVDIMLGYLHHRYGSQVLEWADTRDLVVELDVAPIGYYERAAA